MGLILRYHDPRRFGCILWTQASLATHYLLAKLGPEPLDNVDIAKHLYQCSRGKLRAIKSLLMDSHIIAGIGNIYANEVLFQAKLHPHNICSALSLPQYQLLGIAIKTILLQAIKQGGTTLKDFLNADGKPGYFSQSLCVYKRAGQLCVQCATTIQEIKQHGRSSYFCPHCQIL